MLVSANRLACLFLLPWYTAITGYWISSNNSNSQQQPTAGYRQTRKLLPGVSQPRRVKTTTNGICKWQFNYANTIPTVSCTSNGLICGYVTGIHDERIFMLCVTWNLLQSIENLQLSSNILSANYFVIICAANKSQVTLSVEGSSQFTPIK